MVLSIKNDRADALAREPAELTGESITDTVVAALEARLEHERRRRRPPITMVDTSTPSCGVDEMTRQHPGS